MENLLPGSLLHKVASFSGEAVSAHEAIPQGRDDFTCFFFAANFCPPCREFAPKFYKFYQKFYVTAIPCVMVCNREGRLITRDGRKAVEEQYQYEEENKKEEDGTKLSGRFAREVLERWEQEDWKTL